MYLLTVLLSRPLALASSRIQRPSGLDLSAFFIALIFSSSAFFALCMKNNETYVLFNFILDLLQHNHCLGFVHAVNVPEFFGYDVV